MLRARTTYQQPEALANQVVCKQLPAARASRLAVCPFAWGGNYAVDSDVLLASRRQIPCFGIVTYCDNHVVGLYDACTHVVNPRYGSDTISDNTMSGYESSHLLAALTEELPFRPGQLGQGDRAPEDETRACEPDRFDARSKAHNGRKTAVELGKTPTAEEKTIDASGKNLKQGLKCYSRFVETPGSEHNGSQLDQNNYWHTGTVSWRNYWYTSLQRTYRYSRTPRRRKGGWKRKPLAQRHDAPD